LGDQDDTLKSVIAAIHGLTLSVFLIIINEEGKILRPWQKFDDTKVKYA
jgi:hypothetical protein